MKKLANRTATKATPKQGKATQPVTNPKLHIKAKNASKSARKIMSAPTKRHVFMADEFLSHSMHEITHRKKIATQMRIFEHYEQAFIEYLSDKTIPKRIIKRNRVRVELSMSAKGHKALLDIAKLAYKEERPICALIDEALTVYCKRLENYLGQAFAERYKNAYERLTNN